MTIDTNTMISSTEANQNFSKVAKVFDEHGTEVILKNNIPRYLAIDCSRAEKEKVVSNKDVFAISEHSGKSSAALLWISKKHTMLDGKNGIEQRNIKLKISSIFKIKKLDIFLIINFIENLK